MAQHNDLGRKGEEMAANFLKNKGYHIRHKNWRFGHRDLDIVAVNENETMLVFVEVRTRNYDNKINPIQTIDKKKARSIVVAANSYVREFDIDLELRFDIIGITQNKDLTVEIEHIEDAFVPLAI